MKFGPVPLSDAVGAILAHSITLPKGKLAKGRWLTEDDIAQLAALGMDEVIVAWLEADDIHEDEAATRLAQALVPNPEAQGLRISKATTGRVNLIATGAGIAQINVAAVNALNAVHPMITLATVPAWHRCDPDTMVGTVKIISYGVPEDAITAAVEAAQSAIHIRPPQYKTATLIETRTSDETPSDKGRRATNGRLFRLNMSLTERVVVRHRTDDIAAAIAEASGDVVLILTASATSDPMDVAPSAVRVAGGTVTRFGMPVDPGNLLFLGEVGDRPVIGLPGCARSPALNGADWVLERVICGVPIGDVEISAMGVGGLLKEIPTRPRPREG
ncbi:MAG: molybdopterin-binding protein [Marivivens sp.]|uniref:molybdopterin-binding protein n=1 Tax=Marivivens sp. TaxID=1978374 RepID=UPI0017F93F09|nr:molybdopterin-binding protein [Marivivens sp.]NVJ93998.1 molybdopterin-binding protein [Marivivens sp.]